jgi:poly(A) polymerase
MHQLEPSTVLTQEAAVAISPAARHICATLSAAGFDAFVVGGAVRDLLLSRPPYDFDLATNATTAEITALFPNAVEDGGRFRLVGILIGTEMVQVTTFRAMALDKVQLGASPTVAGTIEEDALQRDFTINAMYLRPGCSDIIDFTGGQRDIREKIVRTIGCPTRFFTDNPWIMLKAIRLSRTLGFSIAPQVESAMLSLAPKLCDAPPVRLLVELSRHLQSGSALDCVRDLCRFGFDKPLLPGEGLKIDADDGFLPGALSAIDQHISGGGKASIAFALACLFWPTIRHRLEKADIRDVTRDVYYMQASTLGILPDTWNELFYIWSMQSVLERKPPGRDRALRNHRRFPAAFNLMTARANVGEVRPEIAAQWRDYCDA